MADQTLTPDFLHCSHADVDPDEFESYLAYLIAVEEGDEKYFYLEEAPYYVIE